jgi:hypothetical protein
MAGINRHSLITPKIESLKEQILYSTVTDFARFRG